MEHKVIVIVGPTCSGKTEIGLLLAKKLKSEIISADSRQVYKYLNIGTAKPSLELLREINHHFIDELEPDEDFNVSKFEKSALHIIENLLAVHKIPIVVGGSGLYIRAIVDGLFEIDDNDEDYRSYLSELRTKFGDAFLFDKLKAIDPEAASKMIPQNWKRICRALEVYHITGNRISELHRKSKRNLNINFLQFGLRWERSKLYDRINARVDQMMNNGLSEEVRYLLSRGLSKEMNALNTVGYKELISYFEGNISSERAVELIKRNTRHYAKRQMTWFNADKRIHWFDIISENQINQISNSIIELSK